LLQYDNRQAVVATQSLARDLHLGLFFTEMQQLRAQLEDETSMTALRASVWSQRQLFTFDYHVERLVAFFRRVIQERTKQ
jgi:hypothetical protein